MGRRERLSRPTWPPPRVSGFTLKKPGSQPAELEMEEMLALGQTLVSSEPIFICDLSGRFLFANDKLQSMLRTSIDDLRTRKVADFIYEHEHQKLLSLVTELRQSTQSSLRRFTLCMNEGEDLVVSVRVALMMSGGEPYRIAGLVRDVTEVALDEQISRRASALAAASKVARRAGHDIRNFLTPARAVINYLNGMEPDKITPDKLSTLKRISQTGDKAIDRVDSIIEELMVISSPGMKNPIMLDVNPILRVLVDELEAHLLETGKECELRLDLDESIPQVRGDRLALEKAFYNILFNSLEAMPGGGTLKVKTEAIMDKGRRMLKVTISDTGCGMSEEIKDKIFDPEFTTKGEKGTGLGLVITMKSITDHNGWIEVNSSPGQGSKFEVFIPV